MRDDAGAQVVGTQGERQSDQGGGDYGRSAYSRGAAPGYAGGVGEGAESAMLTRAAQKPLPRVGTWARGSET